MWEAGLRLWSVGFRSIWERAEASPCPKAPWEGLGFGLLVNETPVLVRLEIALQNCKNVGPLMYLAEKQTRPTSDNAFQLLFSFSNLFWIICLPLQKYFRVVKTELYRLETHMRCCLSSAQAYALACTLDWGVLCVPLIGRIDHFHMVVGCTSATDVSLPPCVFVLLLLSPCSLERCMVGNRMSPTRWHVSTLHFLFSQSLYLCFCLIIDSLILSFNDLFNADSHSD